MKTKNVLMAAALIGLIVGLSVNFHRLSSTHFAAKSEAGVRRIVNPPQERTDAEYWRGTVDEKLIAIESKLNKFSLQIDKLNDNLTEVKLAAAKEGSIYGALASIIVLLTSMLGHSILKGKGK